MSVIEGVGDEVTIVFVLIIILLLGLLAWFSTHTRDLPWVSVILIELTGRRRQNAATDASRSTNVQEESEGSSRRPQNAVPVSSTSEDNSGQNNISVHRRQTGVGESSGSGANDRQSADIAPPRAGHKNNENQDTDFKVSKDSTGVDIDHNKDRLTYETQKNDPGEYVSSVPEDVENDEITETVNSCGTGENETPEELRRHRLAFYDHGQSGQDTPIQEQDNIVTSTTSEESAASREATPQEAENVYSDSANSQTDEQLSQNISIRLKYLNDTQRLVQARLDDTIGDFRRANFAEELSDNKLVRFIYNGQDLRNDLSTLQSYNINDNCVLHCLITRMINQSEAAQGQTDDDGANIGALMLPLFGLILGILWYFRFAHRQYFNAVSTMSLLVISLMYLLGCWTVWRPLQGQTDAQGHLHLD